MRPRLEVAANVKALGGRVLYLPYEGFSRLAAEFTDMRVLSYEGVVLAI